MPATNASKPWPATRWPPRHTHSRRGGRVLVVRQVSGDRRTEPGAGAADLADVHHTIVPWTGGRWYALVSGALDAVSATDLFRRIRRARGTPYPGTWPVLPSHAGREPQCCGPVHCSVSIRKAHHGHSHHLARPPLPDTWPAHGIAITNGSCEPIISPSADRSKASLPLTTRLSHGPFSPHAIIPFPIDPCSCTLQCHDQRTSSSLRVGQIRRECRGAASLWTRHCR